MKKLNKDSIENLLSGNSWYATGGGFPASRAREIFIQILKRSRLLLKNLDEFKDDDYLCVGSGVGSVKNTDVDITKESTKGIKILEEITRYKIKGIVCGETGLECLAADTATKLNLPLVDSDMKGGRAAPEPSINMFNLKNQSVLPAVAINTNGDVAILKKVSDLQKIEIFLRNFANMAGGCFVAWNPRKARDYKKYLINGTVSRAINLGKLINYKIGLEEAVGQVKGKIFFEGRISKIEDENSKGFLIRKATLINEKNKAVVLIKNENLVFIVNNKVRLTCPDLITMIDPKTLLGIHNSQLKKGQEVIIIGIPNHIRWHTKRGHEIFGPSHFQLPFKVKRI